MSSYFLSDRLIAFVEPKAFEHFFELFKHLWDSICDVFNFFINLLDSFSGRNDDFIVDFFVDFYKIVTIEMVGLTFAFFILADSCVFGATLLRAIFMGWIIAFTVDNNSIKEIRGVCFLSIKALRWRFKFLERVILEVFHCFYCLSIICVSIIMWVKIFGMTKKWVYDVSEHNFGGNKVCI